MTERHNEEELREAVLEAIDALMHDDGKRYVTAKEVADRAELDLTVHQAGYAMGTLIPEGVAEPWSRSSGRHRWQLFPD